MFATLRPEGEELAQGWDTALISGRIGLGESIQNVLLFVPLGVALALSRWRWLRLAAAGALVSFAVEYLQAWIPGRGPSVGDVVFNTLGTVCGGALGVIAPPWLAPGGPPARAVRLSLGAAAVAALVCLGTGALLQPAPRDGPYTPRPTPDIDEWGRYPGRVLSTEVAANPLSGPLRIVAVAGHRTGRFAPLVVITDARRHDVLAVAADRADVVLWYRSRATTLTLDQPDLRARGALASVAPGDTLTVAAWREGEPYCLARDAARTCGLGFTVGNGWNLMFYPEHFPPWLLRLLNATWVGGLTLGVGYWGRRHPASAAAVVVCAAALVAAPALTGLLPTPLTEWAGAVAGLLLGVELGVLAAARPLQLVSIPPRSGGPAET